MTALLVYYFLFLIFAYIFTLILFRALMFIFDFFPFLIHTMIKRNRIPPNINYKGKLKL